ncbi:MAG: hypothetical protein IPG21_18670 [Saprospiraceae bacterium]|nr:hypothetical protein [Candidatus Vicinibacter affinis]
MASDSSGCLGCRKTGGRKPSGRWSVRLLLEASGPSQHEGSDPRSPS